MVVFPVDNLSCQMPYTRQAFALIFPFRRPVSGRVMGAVENAFSHRKLSRKLLSRVLNCPSAFRIPSTFLIEWMTVE